MAGPILRNASLGAAKEPEYAYPDRRAWLATVIADIVSRAASPGDERDRPAFDVASSYAATFSPFAMPAVGHAYRLSDGSIEHDGTYVVLPTAERYADNTWGRFLSGAGDERIPCTGLETREELEPRFKEGWTLHLDDEIKPAYLTRPGPHARSYRTTIMVSIDSGGGFVRGPDGQIVRDRREATRLLRGSPDLTRFALALFAEPAVRGRKRRQPWTIARALLFADLRAALGTRPAARRLLAWEDELDAPWRIPGVARLVSRFEAGTARGAEETRALRRAEDAMIRACRRAGAT